MAHHGRKLLAQCCRKGVVHLRPEIDTFTLDLNTGLTQVLADGTNTYLYGSERIGQFAAAESAYFLGDALGSVRQLTDANGSVTLARSYEPYGKVLSSTGTRASVYGFDGEQTDSATGLTYLRARYYDSSVGRFLTRDPWQGSDTRPMSYNAWLFGYSNPVRYSDPSGFIPCPDNLVSDSCTIDDWYAAIFGPLYQQLGISNYTLNTGSYKYNTYGTTTKAYMKGVESYNAVVVPAAEFGLGMMPGGGTAIDLLSALLGKDVITRSQLSNGERVAIVFLSGLGPLDDINDCTRAARVLPPVKPGGLIVDIGTGGSPGHEGLAGLIDLARRYPDSRVIGLDNFYANTRGNLSIFDYIRALLPEQTAQDLTKLSPNAHYLIADMQKAPLPLHSADLITGFAPQREVLTLYVSSARNLVANDGTVVLVVRKADMIGNGESVILEALKQNFSDITVIDHLIGKNVLSGMYDSASPVKVFIAKP